MTPEHVDTKTAEWPAEVQVVVAEADIAEAFDNIEPVVFLQALQHWRVHPRLILASAKEAEGQTAQASMAGLQTNPFGFGKTRQRGRESTFAWNIAMRMAIDKATAHWIGAGFGIEIPLRGRLTHLLWADGVLHRFAYGSRGADHDTTADRHLDGDGGRRAARASPARRTAHHRANLLSRAFRSQMPKLFTESKL